MTKTEGVQQQYLGSQPSTSAIPTNDKRKGGPTFDA